MVGALRAGRVAKPGAPVVVQVWGRHDRCDLEAMKAVPDGRYRLENEFHFVIARGVSRFAVIREAGPVWRDGHGIAGQPGLEEHVLLMDTVGAERLPAVERV